MAVEINLTIKHKATTSICVVNSEVYDGKYHLNDDMIPLIVNGETMMEDDDDDKTPIMTLTKKYSNIECVKAMPNAIQFFFENDDNKDHIIPLGTICIPHLRFLSNVGVDDFIEQYPTSIPFKDLTMILSEAIVQNLV